MPDFPEEQDCLSLSPLEKARFFKELGCDFICLGPEERNEISYWLQATDFFVFCTVDGPFQRACQQEGLFAFLSETCADPAALASCLANQAEGAAEEIAACLAQGTDGIILCDDLGYDRGTFLPPALLKQHYFPLVHNFVDQAGACQTPILLHSDGDIRPLLPEIAANGFQGIHGLTPPAAAAKTHYAHEPQDYGLCLMGNLPVSDLLSSDTPAKTEYLLRQIVTNGMARGGYLFGTSCGLFGGLPVPPLREAYVRVQKYGRYDKSVHSLQMEEGINPPQAPGEQQTARHAGQDISQPGNKSQSGQR